jgi:2-methylcitrate dehydratase
MPAQYELSRILREDVQSLLRRISVMANPAYSERFPAEMPCRIRVVLHDGQSLVRESRDYPGFVSQPMSWEMARAKFDQLAAPYTTDEQREAITTAISDLENVRVRDLMRLLGSACVPALGSRYA